MSNMNGLSSAEITALMGKSRSRNNYGPKLLEFAQSDEAAIDVAAVWPIELSNKSASTLYQGFLNAAKKTTPPLTDTIMVKQADERVFLLHRERVSILAQQNDDD